MSSLSVQRVHLRPRIAVPKNVSAVLVRTVAAVNVLTFIIVVLKSHLILPLFQLWAGGSPWDASSKHLRFAFFFGSGPVICAFRKLGNSDSSDRRALSVPVEIAQYSNSVEVCINACKAEGFDMAGVESAQDCCTYFPSFLRRPFLS
jgi:hypothetical protein